MTPRFSCADFTFPLLPHEKVLDLLRLLDFTAVDLGIFEDRSHHYPSEIARDPRAAAVRLKDSLDRRDLVPADVFVQTGAEPPVAAANDPDPELQARNAATFQAMIEFTAQLGATHLTGLPGVVHQGSDPAADWDRAVEEARRRVDASRERGLTYAVEPHIGSILPDPQTTLRFLEAVPGLTLTLDYGHFIFGGMDSASVHPLIPHASHFHARGGAEGLLQTPVEDNVIDFPAILRKLRDCGYSGYLCLEYVYVNWAGCNRTDNLSETLRLRKQLEEKRVSPRKVTNLSCLGLTWLVC